ncbi:hypothetical protein ACFQ0M_12070 [Kitasatospora aburaviensis]
MALTVLLVAAASLAVLVLGVSAISRRLLGIRVGPLRALAAGLVALGIMVSLEPSPGSTAVSRRCSASSSRSPCSPRW